MNTRIEKYPLVPLVHGRMIYSCEQCGRSWPMYLEKGIEEFGENHKPSPFMIVCPHCGGWAMDVSGILKIPEAYMVITGGAGCFANVEGKECGVPTFPNMKMVDIESAQYDEEMARMIEEFKERIRIKVNQEIEEAVLALAEEAKSSKALSNLMQAMMEDLLCSRSDADEHSTGGCAKPGKFIICRTAWDRMEEREKRRTAERETAARFRHRKVRESAWNAKKRTGKRRREWRGPWKESKSD